MTRVNQLWQDEQEVRWQQHYDEYVESMGSDLSPINGPLCAEQYANDMMDEENAERDREPYVPSAEYLAWCAKADSARTTVVHGEPIKRRRAA